MIDVHAHLHVKEFDADRAAVIERAGVGGISKIINIGFDVEGNFAALALAKKYEFIYATMGIHPHLASEWNDQVGAKIYDTVICERKSINKFFNSASAQRERENRSAEATKSGATKRRFSLIKKEEKIVALGEMGLDYYKNFQPKDLQERAFRGQLKLAQEVDLPVIIHCRDAFKDAFRILAEEKIERVLLHCYTGTIEQAEEAWSRGYYSAFTGIITYPSADQLCDVVKKCPLDKLLIETDCPFLVPQGHRGERNEPAYLGEIFDKVCKIKSISSAKLEQAIEKNTKTLFGI